MFECEVDGEAVVVKVANTSTKTGYPRMMRANLEGEAATLRALRNAQCKSVPRLVAFGKEGGPEVRYLVLAPRGVPLVEFASTAVSSAPEALRKLARQVARDTLRALHGA